MSAPAGIPVEEAAALCIDPPRHQIGWRQCTDYVGSIVYQTASIRGFGKDLTQRGTASSADVSYQGCARENRKLAPTGHAYRWVCSPSSRRRRAPPLDAGAGNRSDRCSRLTDAVCRRSWLHRVRPRHPKNRVRSKNVLRGACCWECQFSTAANATCARQVPPLNSKNVESGQQAEDPKEWFG